MYPPCINALLAKIRKGSTSLKLTEYSKIMTLYKRNLEEWTTRIRELEVSDLPLVKPLVTMTLALLAQQANELLRLKATHKNLVELLVSRGVAKDPTLMTLKALEQLWKALPPKQYPCPPFYDSSAEARTEVSALNQEESSFFQSDQRAVAGGISASTDISASLVPAVDREDSFENIDAGAENGVVNIDVDDGCRSSCIVDGSDKPHFPSRASASASGSVSDASPASRGGWGTSTWNLRYWVDSVSTPMCTPAPVPPSFGGDSSGTVRDTGSHARRENLMMSPDGILSPTYTSPISAGTPRTGPDSHSADSNGRRHVSVAHEFRSPRSTPRSVSDYGIPSSQDTPLHMKDSPSALYLDSWTQRTDPNRLETSKDNDVKAPQSSVLAIFVQKVKSILGLTATPAQHLTSLATYSNSNHDPDSTNELTTTRSPEEVNANGGSLLSSPSTSHHEVGVQNSNHRSNWTSELSPRNDHGHDPDPTAGASTASACPLRVGGNVKVKDKQLVVDNSLKEGDELDTDLTLGPVSERIFERSKEGRRGAKTEGGHRRITGGRTNVLSSDTTGVGSASASQAPGRRIGLGSKRKASSGDDGGNGGRYSTVQRTANGREVHHSSPGKATGDSGDSGTLYSNAGPRGRQVRRREGEGEGQGPPSLSESSSAYSRNIHHLHIHEMNNLEITDYPAEYAEQYAMSSNMMKCFSEDLYEWLENSLKVIIFDTARLYVGSSRRPALLHDVLDLNLNSWDPEKGNAPDPYSSDACGGNMRSK